MDRSVCNRLLGSAALAAAFLAADLAHAQAQTVPRGSTVGELVVTAEKRPERLSDVAASVSVVPGGTLETMEATQLQDWAGFVPGLTVADQGAPGESSIAVDGIAPIAAASEVGLYVNDTPVGTSSSFQGGNGFSIDLLPYDLSRVEVLRGPQGTLYGASTMGGLIKYVLAAPDLDTFSGRIGGDVFGMANAHEPGGGGARGSEHPARQGSARPAPVGL
jgi:iron complex outermembrane receptor protein